MLASLVTRDGANECDGCEGCVGEPLDDARFIDDTSSAVSRATRSASYAGAGGSCCRLPGDGGGRISTTDSKSCMHAATFGRSNH